MQALSFLKTKYLLLAFIGFCFTTKLQAQQTDPVEFVQTLQQAQKASAEKKWTEAVPLWAKLTESNPVNGEYWYNLGNAYYNTGEYIKSIEAYQKQLELKWDNLYNIAYNIACNYALAGQKEPALDWLQKAFDLGFTSFTHAQNDADLKSLHGNPRFTKILGLDDVSKMSRTQGWQYDMEILKREVMRKAYIRRSQSFDEFNKRYNAIYNSVEKKTDVQMIMELMKLMVLVGDGHSSLFPPSRKEFQMALPLQFYSFKEGTYVVAADPKYKELIGSKVIAFEKTPVETVSNKLKELISRDNDMGIMQNLPSLMRHTVALHGLGLTADPANTTLKLEDAKGKIFTARVEADTTVVRVDHKSIPEGWATLQQNAGTPLPLYLKNIKALYWFEELPQLKTVYLQFNSVRNDKKESLAQFTDRLFGYIRDSSIEKLIIDLRWNNGGNTMLLPYFINAIIKNDKINRKGNLYVITGRRTFSAAQNLATYLEKQTAAIFAGEPTGSSPNFVGEEDFITLPYSKLAMNVSDLYWQSSWPGDERTWIAPMLYVPPTFKAYSVNKDEALDAVTSVIKASAKKGF
jgi:tetratricopeptide (TPR) repeat protein